MRPHRLSLGAFAHTDKEIGDGAWGWSDAGRRSACARSYAMQAIEADDIGTGGLPRAAAQTRVVVGRVALGDRGNLTDQRRPGVARDGKVGIWSRPEK